MMLNKLVVSSLLFFLFLSIQPFTGYAQSYPIKPITIIVPMGAGGASDTLIRVIAPYWSEQIGKPIIIENKAGANGLIGENIFVTAKPDGYTLMLGSSSATTNLWLHKLSYDPLKVFIPITKIAAVPMALTISTERIKLKNLKEFLIFSKEQKTPLVFAHWGEGSVSHIAVEMFAKKTQTNYSLVPYKTSPQAMNDLLSGHVDGLFLGLAAAKQQLGTGKLNILGITSPERSAIAPQIPTMSELGVSDFEFESWFGIFSVAETPTSIQNQIYQSLVKTLNNQELKAKLSNMGYRVIADSPEQFEKYYLNEIAINEKIIRHD